MKKLAIAISLIVAIASAGCLNGRSGPGQLTRSRLQFEKTKTSEVFDLDSHKDVTVDELKRTAPDGSTIEVRGYKSRANDAAIESGKLQAEAARQSVADFVSMFREFGGLAAQYFSAGAVRPQQPQVIIVTNYVPVVAGTNAVSK